MKISRLPRNLTAHAVLTKIGDTFHLDEPPGEICFDFTNVRFAKPSGIVLMHNLTRYLLRRDWRVFYGGTDVESDAHHFLDDIGFFEDHLKTKVWPSSSHRATTCRLIEVRNAQSHEWINGTFIPWLANCANRPEGALASLRTCISELFNNIRDHTSVEVGSIFAQWYPNKENLEFTIGDFGPGIPSNVARLIPDLSPGASIAQAFVEGFSTKGNPNNRGAGLNFLRETIVQSLGGTICVYSGGGRAESDFTGQIIPIDVTLGNSGYAGTLIDVVLPTNKIDAYDPEAEEDIW